MAEESKYFIRVITTTSGKRLPLLLCKASWEPVPLVLTYQVDTGRATGQVNTLTRRLSVIGWLYDFADMRNVDLGTTLRQQGCLDREFVLAFARWIQSGRTKVAGTVGKDVKPPILPETVNVYMSCLKHFLEWVAELHGHAVDQPDEAIGHAIHRVRKLFKACTLRGGGKKMLRKGLDDEAYRHLVNVIKVDSPDNPFKPSLRVRNYALIMLFLETGIRRGEALKIRAMHLPGGQSPFLKIRRSEDDPDDPRRDEPHLKTRERDIPLTPGLASTLSTYLRVHRPRVRSDYLFLSSQGLPMSLSAVNDVFKRIRTVFPGIYSELTPHVLRHTYNEHFMRRCDDEGMDQDKRRKLQNYLCGWTEGSNQSDAYTRRYIEEEALRLLSSIGDDLYGGKR